MADLIDRDAVIKQIAETQDKVSNGIEDVTFYRAIKIIRNAPAVNRWIPCSERLPEHDGEYLVYTNRYEIVEYDTELREFGHTDEYKDELGYTVVEWYETHNVTHWMPLPEPPEGGAG